LGIAGAESPGEPEDGEPAAESGAANTFCQCRLLLAPRVDLELGNVSAKRSRGESVRVCPEGGSLETGKIHPVTVEDCERALKPMQSSASEWLATARNYARYSNEGGQYDELTEFLKRVKRW